MKAISKSFKRGFSGTRRKRKFCGAKRIFKDWDDFCAATSLHGLKYVQDRNLSPWVRLFFLIAFTVAFVVMVNYVLNIYSKWANNPVIVGMSSVPISVKKIPFPAITICNMNLARSSQVLQLKKGTVEYSILKILCSQKLETNEKEHIGTWKDFKRISQPCSRMLIACKFGSVEANCSEFFRSVVSQEGVCCSFNMATDAMMYRNKWNDDFLSSNQLESFKIVNWSTEKGYPNEKGSFYPRPGAGLGSEFGLTVIVDAEIDDYYCSSTNGYGFKIFLHNPNEVPNTVSNAIPVGVGFNGRIAIKPDLSIASPALRTLDQDQRQCIFNDENKLLHFANYLTNSCELEYETLQLIDKCNCVEYHMPKIYPNVRICGLRDEPCFRNRVLCENDKNCSNSCLPGCYELKFSATATTSGFRQRNFTITSRTIQKRTIEYAAGNLALLEFFYMDNSVEAKSRDLYFGITDFVASTGGILSLFLGFSMISLVEIVYYIFIRPLIRQRSAELRRINRLLTNERSIKNSKRTSPMTDPPLYAYNEQHFKRRIGFGTRELENISYCN